MRRSPHFPAILRDAFSGKCRANPLGIIPMSKATSLKAAKAGRFQLTVLGDAPIRPKGKTARIRVQPGRVKFPSLNDSFGRRVNPCMDSSVKRCCRLPSASFDPKAIGIAERRAKSAATVHGGYGRNLLFRTFPLTSMRSIWVARNAPSGKHGFRFGDVFNGHFDW
jgi:hypothetical protein